MKFVDGVILLIIAAIVAGVFRIMNKQKKSGGCHSGCAGCSKAKSCSSKR